FMMQMGGGEARPLTDLPRGATSPAWAPDGKTIAFSTTATADDLKKQREEREKASDEKKDADKKETENKDGAPTPHKSDVKAITRAVYRANGNPDFLEADRHSHIWTLAVVDDPLAKAPDPRQVTSGEFDERFAEWAPDGSAIYFTSTRVAEPYYE